MPRKGKGSTPLDWKTLPPRHKVHKVQPTKLQRRRPRRPCSNCRRQQPLELLITGLGVRAGAYCESCWSDLVANFANRQRGGETLSRYYERTYGITLEKYGKLFLEQRGACAICRTTPTNDQPLAVDHDHANGAVRGLLCRNCNVGLGFFRDATVNLARAIVYLQESV